MSNQESKLTDAVNTSRMILDRLATDRGVASVPALGSRRATVENCVAHFRWYFRRPVPPREATVKQEQYAKLRDALYGADGSNECLTEPVRMEHSLFSTSDASESASRVMFPRPCHRKSFRVRDVTMLRDDEAPPALQAPLGCLADGFNLGGDVSIDQEAHLLLLAGSALHARSVLIRAALYSCYGVPGLVEQLYPSTAPDVSRRRLASRHVERRGHLRQRHRLAEQLRLKALVNRDRDTACLLVRAATIMDGHPVEGLDQMESGVQPGSSSLESTGGLFNSTRTLLSDAARRCGRFVSEENARRDQSATMPTPLLVSIEHVSSALTVQPEQV